MTKEERDFYKAQVREELLKEMEEYPERFVKEIAHDWKKQWVHDCRIEMERLGALSMSIKQRARLFCNDPIMPQDVFHSEVDRYRTYVAGIVNLMYGSNVKNEAVYIKKMAMLVKIVDIIVDTRKASDNEKAQTLCDDFIAIKNVPFGPTANTSLPGDNKNAIAHSLLKKKGVKF